MSEVEDIVESIIPLARRWKLATGRSLGVTGEIGEHLACKTMGWSLAAHLQKGWDAIGEDGRKIQIKSRVLQSTCDKSPTMSTVRLDREWDTVALVIMDENIALTEILEATREAFEPLQIARGGSGVSISKFRRISSSIWARPQIRDPDPDHDTDVILDESDMNDRRDIDLTEEAGLRSEKTNAAVPFRGRIKSLAMKKYRTPEQDQELRCLRRERSRIIGIKAANPEEEWLAESYTWVQTKVGFRRRHPNMHEKPCFDAGIRMPGKAKSETRFWYEREDLIRQLKGK